jgi:hypothetical protein
LQNNTHNEKANVFLTDYLRFYSNAIRARFWSINNIEVK